MIYNYLVPPIFTISGCSIIKKFGARQFYQVVNLSGVFSFTVNYTHWWAV
ncbi:MAG: hypothetical protein ACP5FK_08590 [bacterium]